MGGKANVPFFPMTISPNPPNCGKPQHQNFPLAIKKYVMNPKNMPDLFTSEWSRREWEGSRGTGSDITP